jgi:glutamate--cysteine ligase
VSAPSLSGGAVITDKRQLVEYLAAGCKPPADWRIGTEHEKFVFRLKDHGTVALRAPPASTRCWWA